MPKRKIIFVCCILVFVALGAILYFYRSQTPKQTLVNLKCPEDYATYDEYMVALGNYFKQEVSNNPNITAEDLAEKRYAFLVANHCTKTLQNLQNNLPGGSGTTTEDIIKNELDTYNAKTP